VSLFFSFPFFFFGDPFLFHLFSPLMGSMGFVSRSAPLCIYFLFSSREKKQKTHEFHTKKN